MSPCKMPVLLFAILIPIFCFSQEPVKYIFSLEKPAGDSNLQYGNEKILFTFSFDETGINVQITNRDSKSITLLWNDVNLFENGNTERIIHEGVINTAFLNPIVIPPQSNLKDHIVPLKNAAYSAQYGWTFGNLLDKNYSHLGEQLSLYLAIASNEGKKTEYNFLFKIIRCEGCEQLKNNDPVKAPRLHIIKNQ